MSDRPKYNDQKIIDEAAGRLLPDVISWLKENGAYEDDEIEVCHDLATAIRYHSDGYDIAKTLEDTFRFSPDANLVEILDKVSHFKSAAKQAAVKQWVVDNGIVATLSAGALVKTKKGDGVIVGVRADTAEYIVQTIDGTWRGEKDGFILAVEECEAIA